MFSVLLLIFIPLSNIWMTIDAIRNKIPISGEKYNINTGGVAWFFSGVLLWVVTFPYYLLRRRDVLGKREEMSLLQGPGPTGPPIASPGEPERR